jgi:lipid A 3-O-deacylase
MSKVRGTYWACLLSLACALAGSARIHAACAADSEQTSFNAGAVSVLGSEPSYIDVGAGVFDALSEGAGNRSAAGRIELRLGTKLLFIGPTIGLMANTDGGVFGYGGIYADIKYREFVLTPVLALGGYHRGDSKDLGGVFQFRVGLGLSYQFEGGSRLGVRVDHISNAHIHDENPGEEEFLFTYAVPLGRLF